MSEEIKIVLNFAPNPEGLDMERAREIVTAALRRQYHHDTYVEVDNLPLAGREVVRHDPDGSRWKLTENGRWFMVVQPAGM